ncbi:hypothetical protein Pmani_006482 [Petrolisthes manimaculis]|uniref:Uncharacterized protein n=1 Tax=Petrolisthes manimaculis TaxID=1843537 RepID=A0AAE1UGG6_9EUCA|nr:hypothetical protein Pmani_006482 [Petrolisthes manimaculis]
MAWPKLHAGPALPIHHPCPTTRGFLFLVPSYRHLQPELKAAIISSHSMMAQKYLRALEEVQLDGRCPSELLRHMQQLNDKAIMPFNDYVLKGRHSKLLPTIIQLLFQAQPDLPLREYGKLADALITTYTKGIHTWPTQHTSATIAMPPLCRDRYPLLNSNQRHHPRSSL